MTTQPAGNDLSDEDMVEQVTGQTSSDLQVEDTFEREADGVDTADDGPTEAAKAPAEEFGN